MIDVSMLRVIRILTSALICFVCLSAVSCDKEKNQPEIVELEYNSIRFRLIIEEDFDSLTAMSLVTYVSRSDKNKTEVINSFYKNYSDRPNYKFDLKDTLWSTMSPFRDSIVFDSVDVRYKFEFNAIYTNSNHPKRDCKNNYYWKLDTKQANSINDTLITIYFPRDTIKGRQYDWTTELPIEEVCGE